MSEPVKKMTPYTPAWKKIADNLARDHAPEIYPCKKCGYPVAAGYRCGGCGTGEPR